ncbi:MAG TPA: homoserine dehydrogenase [Acidimicrobiales bacterium]|nr:homoserine dehydrogenase [Acidimicrobiales bacterium]
MSDVVRVGVLGCGNVGGALVQILTTDAPAIAERTGLRLEVTRIAVRDVGKDRGLDLPADRFTADPFSVVNDPDIDVVVEIIGGIEPARSLILDALKAGKPVITGNKEVVATAGAELFEVAHAAGRDLLFEAAVAGGIPLIRPLRESLAGEPITRVMGIVNGTTNYILTRMTDAGVSYDDALAEAQALGYAEPDPTADVEGFDAASKAAIIASIAFGVRVVADDVYREGISGITETDILFATKLGYVIKLLAIVEKVDGLVAARVHPTMVPFTHALASVRDAFNAVFIEGDAVGELMLYGRGAGGRPTASALLGDLLDAAHNLKAGGAGRSPTLTEAALRPMDDLHSQYFFTMDVADAPGVLEQVAGVTGRHRVSIRSLDQVPLGDRARLGIVFHSSLERDMQSTLRDLRTLPVVERVGSLMRVIGPE